MQFATFPLRLRLVKFSTEMYYCFFPPHFLGSLNYSSPPAVLLSIMYQGCFGWQQVETFPLNPAAAGWTSVLQYCYFHRQQGSVCVRPPIWSRISLHGGRRKKLHASDVVKSHFWTPWCKKKKKKSNLTYYQWKMCPVLFIIRRSDLEQFRQRVTSSRHQCNY